MKVCMRAINKNNKKKNLVSELDVGSGEQDTLQIK